MTKIQLKSDNITPFGGLYSIFNLFDRSGVRKTIDSFPFDGCLPGERLRLVVQRTRIGDEDTSAEPEGLFGAEYMYRRILTNDRDNSEQDIIAYYNRRGASERNFDCQNNDF